jgi:hypothetical protein
VFAHAVDAAAIPAFEAAYAPDGEWARFFAQAGGYVGTELWRAAAEALYRSETALGRLAAV